MLHFGRAPADTDWRERIESITLPPLQWFVYPIEELPPRQADGGLAEPSSEARGTGLERDNDSSSSDSSSDGDYSEDEVPVVGPLGEER